MLQIPDVRERALVRTVDAALAIVATLARPFTRGATEPRRILLLRLERIGDLVMALEAIGDVRALAPAAQIDLVVGSWNAALAQAVPGVTASRRSMREWLARDGGGLGMPALLRAAWSWRIRRYDLAINFEPDMRSNLVLGGVRRSQNRRLAKRRRRPAPRRRARLRPVGSHVDNARRLVQAAFRPHAAGVVGAAPEVPEVATAAAAAILRPGNWPTAGRRARQRRAGDQAVAA